MYDAIVVGARCGGSPTAMLLARKGYRVLLVDKATFPSDSFRGHFLQNTGAAYLKRWGLLDSIARSNCPPMTKWLLDLGPMALSGTAPAADGQLACFAPRRKLLDKILVDAAAAAGVELREGFTVEELVVEGEQVVGIRGHGQGGGTVTEQARIVIGADGQHSLVAQQVGAPSYNEKPALACWYYSYWSGVPMEGPELYLRDHRVVLGFPTNDGLTLIGAGWPQADFYWVRADVERHHREALAQVPQFAERVSSGMREERFLGSGDLPNFFRKPYGPGWALVGDAGYHKDPVLGQGMTDAFRDADLLSEAIDAGFSSRQPLDQALASYEQQRNQAALPMYELNAQLATLEPPPVEMQQLLGALQGNQEQIDRFFGVVTDAVPVTEFFSPENIGQIMAAAGAIPA